MQEIVKEFRQNIQRGNRKGAFFVAFYRIAHKCTVNRLFRIVGLPYLLFYHWVIRDMFSFDIHEKTNIGKNLCVWHCFGIAINPNVVIGDNCTMRHNTTIGGNEDAVPKLGNDIEIGTGAIILGKIKISNNVIIGAGSIVVKDIPENVVVAGNPAKIIKNI